MDKNKIAALEPRQKPDIKALTAEIGSAANDAAAFTAQLKRSRELRHCLWPGQSEDGRKHAAAYAEATNAEPETLDVMPWEGASDARVPIIDEIIVERGMVLLAATNRGRANIVPRGIEDAPNAPLAQQVLDYVTTHLMGDEIMCELPKLADWQDQYGHAVLGISWKEETGYVKRAMNFEAIVDGILEARLLQRQAALQAGGASPDDAQAEAVLANKMRAEIERSLLAFDGRVLEEGDDSPPEPNLDPLKAAVVDTDPEIAGADVERTALALWENGAGKDGAQPGDPVEYYAEVLVENRPQWRALIPMVDVIYPAGTRSLETARWIAQVHWFSEAELRARADAEGWDEKWVKGVLEKPGRAFGGESASWILGGLDVGEALIGGEVSDKLAGTGEDELKMFQVVELFYRAASAGGPAALYRTILHGSNSEAYALHECCPYAGGKYPFVEFCYEGRARLLLEQRGVPEIAATMQHQIKSQWDSRLDHTALSIRPPLIKPLNLAGGSVRDHVRPGGELWERRAGSLRWMDPPQGAAVSKSVEIESSIQAWLDHYFGRAKDGVPPARIQLVQQSMVDAWFGSLSRALKITFALLQEFMPDIEASRIAGVPVDLAATRDDIRGQFDFDLQFDVRDLDTEWLTAKLRLINDLAVPNDNEGVINRGALVRWIITSIDPKLALFAVKDSDQAAQEEQADELDALTKIMAGVEPPMVEGQNHQLRLQILQQYPQMSPAVAKRLQEDETVRAIYEARVKHHNHMVEQDQNRIIGRLGAASGLPGAAA